MAPMRVAAGRSRTPWLLCRNHERFLFGSGQLAFRNGSSQSAAQSLIRQSTQHKQSHKDRKRAKEKDREFLESVLGASTTKRDVKAFLSRFGEKSKGSAPQPKPVVTSPESRVNLGALYSPNRAVENSPVFSFKDTTAHFPKVDYKIHVVAVKLQDPQSLSDELLEGIATTLGQLAKLGVISVVVPDIGVTNTERETLALVHEQCDRLSSAIVEKWDAGARIVDQALESTSGADSGINIRLEKLLANPLAKGIIPIIPPLIVSPDSHMESVDANDIMILLSQKLQQIDLKNEKILDSTLPRSGISLDRIIFLDQNGGIPDFLHANRTQLFVNLSQEHTTISNNLANSSSSPNGSSVRWQKTLDCIKNCLAVLPDTASALLTTPEEVAQSASSKTPTQTITGVGTRRRRNRLIHNILTNKPIVSSSLPVGRLQSHDSKTTSRYTSTFFKRGMPLTIVPDPSQEPWTGPEMSGKYLNLEDDPRIDLDKLIHLMEDSFGRPLDVPHYLARIRNHLAGVIIAGDYEGGAILTWEDPPGRPGRPPVPYLDKFAVLRRSQGSGGVADILFNAMVRNCFPSGVVWRSRRENPVNKWYFERARGTWQMPGSGWTMFWTGSAIDKTKQQPDLKNESEKSKELEERWKDFVAVCKGIQPSWADRQKPPD